MFYRFVTGKSLGVADHDLVLPCVTDWQAMLIAIGLSHNEGSVEIWSDRFVARVPARPASTGSRMQGPVARGTPLEVA